VLFRSGGSDGIGWPFGRPVAQGELFAALQQVNGVEYVAEARIFGADPVTGEHGPEVQRLDLPPNALVFSYDHQVEVDQQ